MDFSGQLDFSDLSWDSNKQKEVEPYVDLMTVTGERIIFKASELSYSRDEFPNDTYQSAAKKIAEHVIAWRDSSNLFVDKPLSYHIPSYQQFQSRTITFSKSGVTHNYDNLDTWHYWFMSALDSLIREKW